jgi:hypothetical protein
MPQSRSFDKIYPYYDNNNIATAGASLNNARILAGCGEDCILVQAGYPEDVIDQIAPHGVYAIYADMQYAIFHRRVRDTSRLYNTDPVSVTMQATPQWKRFVQILNPNLHQLIESYNVKPTSPLEDRPSMPIWQARHVSRSLVYRTIISRAGLKYLRESHEMNEKSRLGKETLKTLEILLARIEIGE